MKKTYKFISWNVNGIRAVDKKDALKWIDDDNIDILGVQETKSQIDQIPKSIFTKEFNFKLASQSAIKGRSGTALFSDIEPFFESTCQKVDILDEGRINEIHFNIKDKKIAYFNIYFPNGQSNEDRLNYKMEFYDRFLEYCKELRNDGFSIIVCGDVNTAHEPIDLARPKANENTSGFLQMERDWISKFIDEGFLDTFRLINGDLKDKYSWWSYRANARENNVGWRIDYFFVSKDLETFVKDAYIMDDIFGSDHCPVALTMEF
ncbi:MAG TPA: exodeoxyribonuclease III [Aliarcobacter thereius]|uniref:Exodeoxyribonuclease III n=1 Tax=Aliarcobacter thereius TaxID=544718 RepID=A0A5R9H4E4_9BACT|nr:exodeoxyribonuclease III [Aliarcobacter thereius]TLS70948.1 exodeoxyribonuclease III [Aliarcobacter thereius]HJE02639.1 exodeoxyribonuclease III [Aliarcobacter thereius]